MKKLLLLGLLIILGGLFFYKVTIAPTSYDITNNNTQDGCEDLPGYSWCEEKAKCLRKDEELCDVISPIANMTVLVDGTEVHLQAGSAEVTVTPESASKETYRIFGEPVHGDVSSDGISDMVFYLTKDGSGSGTFYYAVIALGDGSGYVSKEAVFLGDRIAPQNILISEGNAIVAFAERAPSESFATPPSIGKSLILHYDNMTDTVGELIQDFEGEADALRMTLTMKKWKWVQTAYKNGSCSCPTGYVELGNSCEPVCRNSTPPCMAPSIACDAVTTGNVVTPKKADVFTLSFTSEGTVAVGTDCNSMSSTYEKIGSGGEKQKISFGQITSTSMYCEGSQEQEFSDLLTRTTAYAFTSKGELLLFQSDEGVTTLK